MGEWVLPPVQSPRILSPVEMAAKVQAVSAAPVSTPATLAECLADMPAGTLICGSFFLLGEVVEFGETEQLFANPVDKRTEDYISGRFG